MAVKTITIDLQAYDILAGNRQGDESFSQIIKRTMRKPVDIRQWVAKFRDSDLGDDFIDAVEQQIQQRSAPRNRRRRHALPR